MFDEEQQDEQAGSETEERTDREDGGPTSAEGSDEEATGAGHGTRESEFEAHE